MMIPALVRFECRALWRNPAQMALIGLFALISLYAVFQGAAYRSNIDAAALNFEAEQLEAARNWRERVLAIEAGSVDPVDDRWAGLAMDVTLPAVARPGPLADLARGVSDIHPFTSRVSLWRSVDRLFGNHQFQSPAVLRSGQVDLAFVIVFLLPLLMIVLSFGVLAGDRDSGRLGMVMSQPVRLTRVVSTKLAVRLGLTGLVLAIAMLASLFAGADGLPDAPRLSRFALWAAMALAYFAFWAGAIFWIVSLNRRGELTALLLMGVWVLNSLVGPAGLSTAAQLVYPAPSQLAYLSDARDVSSDAYRSRADVMQGMLLDHPDLTANNYSIPEYIRTAFLVTRTVDNSVAPVLAEFDAVQERRRAFLGQVQFASPAALTLQAFNRIAGTDLPRQVRFERETRQFKTGIADYVEANVLTGERLTVAQIDGLPSFGFRETSVAALATSFMLPFGFLFLLALLLAAAGWRNLSRLQTRLREA